MSLEQDNARADPKKFWTRFIQPRMTQIQGLSYRDEPEVIEAARRTIDTEVAAMRAAISSLLTRRNALSPISSLPAELLTHVFRFHAVNEPPSDLNITSNPLGWIRATHVCRSWRETALQNPCLWSEIRGRLGEKWMAEILKRTKSTPISYSQVSYLGKRPGSVIASRVLPHQLFRIRHLSITDHTHTMAGIVQSLIGTPAPILESIHLFKTDIGGPILLPDLFAGHSPALRRLEMTCIQIPWSAPILRGLHHLKIKSPWSSEPILGSISIPEYYNQFFLALKAMPHLRTLDLGHCLPVRPGQIEAELNVNLPCLEALSLHSEDTAECVDILQHITVPRSCRVFVACDEFSHIHLEEIRDLIKAHTNANTNHAPPLTIFISILDDDDPVFTINFWRTARSPHLLDICPAPDFSLQISRPDEDDLIMVLLKVLVRSLWIEPINSLIVGDHSISLGAFEWIDIFHPYSALENVRVFGATAVTFSDALGMPVEQVEHDQYKDGQGAKNVLTKKHIFLKRLKFVELRALDFSSDDDDEGDFYKGFKTWIKARKGAAGMLPTFAIRDCSISPDQIEGLKEIAEIDWDLIEKLRDTE